MTPKELESLTDDELMRRLDQAGAVERMLHSDGWMLFEEQCRRVYLRADRDLDTVDPSNYTKIAELQIMRKFYREILPSIKNLFKQDGQVAFSHAQGRGLISRAMHYLTQTPGA